MLGEKHRRSNSNKKRETRGKPDRREGKRAKATCKDAEKGSDVEARGGKHFFPSMQTLIWLAQQGVNKLDN